MDEKEDVSQKIDLSEPENYGLMYVLFQELIKKFHPDFQTENTPLNNAESWSNTENFSIILAEKCNKEVSRKYKGERFDKNDKKKTEQIDKLIKRHHIGYTTIKSIIASLQGEPHRIGKTDNLDIRKSNEVHQPLLKARSIKLKFDIKKVDSLCGLLGYFDWLQYSEYSANITKAEKIIASNKDTIERYKKLVNTNPESQPIPKIYINLRASNIIGDEKKLLARIHKSFQERLIHTGLEDNYILEFNDTNDILRKDEKERELAKENTADIAIWGYIDTEENSALWAQWRYSVIGTKYTSRFLESIYSSPREKTSINAIRYGEFCGNFDYTLHLIAAIESLLIDKGDIAAALTHLERIPDDDKSDEAWFIQGSCLYDRGDRAEGVKCWEKALELNPNHKKAIVNLCHHKFWASQKSASEEDTVAQIKHQLAQLQLGEEDFEVKAHISLLLADMGDGDEAISVLLKESISKSSFPGIEYIYLKLAMLSQEQEHFRGYLKKATLSSNDEVFHRFCREQLEDRFLKKSERESFQEEISTTLSSKGFTRQIVRVYKQQDNNGKNGTIFPGVEVFDLRDKLEIFSEDNTPVKIGDVVPDCYSIRSKNGEALGSVIRLNSAGKSIGLRRLKVPSGVSRPVKDCIFPYMGSLKDVEFTDSRLFLHSLDIENKILTHNKTLRILNEKNQKYFIANIQESGRYVLEKTALQNWLKHDEDTLLTLQIQLQNDSGEFVLFENLKLLITDEDALRERVKAFTAYLRYESQKEYFITIAAYLSDFYAYTEAGDVKRWLERSDS